MFRQVIKYRRKISESFLVAFEEGDVKMTRLLNQLKNKKSCTSVKGQLFNIYLEQSYRMSVIIDIHA